jgi:hypothetical protein
MVYFYTLTSSTGYIALSPANNGDVKHDILEVGPHTRKLGQRLEVALLFVCRQIYAESKDLLWKHNTLHPGLRCTYMGAIDVKQLYPVQKLDIELAAFLNLSTRSWQTILNKLCTCAECGSLREITVRQYVESPDYSEYYPEYFEEHLSVMSDLGQIGDLCQASRMAAGEVYELVGKTEVEQRDWWAGTKDKTERVVIMDKISKDFDGKMLVYGVSYLRDGRKMRIHSFDRPAAFLGVTASIHIALSECVRGKI